MSSKILINAIDPDECRIAKVKDSKLIEFNIDTAAREITRGNIYKAKIFRIEPGLQAAFVDYGGERHGFLQIDEIHSDYFQDTQSGERSIKDIIKTGQEILVQVTKDPALNKGALLTTFISLPGRRMVLMPGSTGRGISRKIEDENERNRLKAIVTKLTVPAGFGLIVRTAGENATKTLLEQDLRYLLRLWKTIKEKGIQEPTPALLYKERSFAIRSIRDSFTSDVTEILIDHAAVYQEIKDFVKIISPKHENIVKYHTGPKPIFTRYQLEEQIATIFESRVPLKSGGSIVIEQAEALVAIDVNSGKSTRLKSIEQTAFQTNLEAAEEIARQLRLRDLGGLIVIDFIDMKDRKHKAEVEKAVKTHLKIDKARTNVGRVSKFGLMEMSRQRIRPSIEFGTYIPCPHCRGKGMTPSAETLGLGFLRKLSLELLKEDVSEAKGIVPVPVAQYLLNRKRKELLELESRRKIHITIEGDSSLTPGDNKIICENKRT
ncbi:MAG: Rne/Rng family ribonuclease [Desulfobacteraceae bacterium]|nr:MAG: Rne/Rng family ribonuclease [Desulfobacteraceae bacterium]